MTLWIATFCTRQAKKIKIESFIACVLIDNGMEQLVNGMLMKPIMKMKNLKPVYFTLAVRISEVSNYPASYMTYN